MEEPWQGIQDYSIDLYGDELAQPIENFIPIYRRAKEERPGSNPVKWAEGNVIGSMNKIRAYFSEDAYAIKISKTLACDVT